MVDPLIDRMAKSVNDERIRKALATLTPRQENVLRRALGIGKPSQTVKEIAESFAVSPSRIYQIINAALKRLRDPTVKELRSYIESDLPTNETNNNLSSHLIDIISTVSKLSPHLIEYLKIRPADLPKLPWDVFEHLIAEFFASWGYEDVRLVGRDQKTAADIYAVQKSDPSGVRIRYFIEVKRTRDKIGVEVINGVYGAMEREKSVHGWHVAMIVSFAGFKELRGTNPLQLTLQGLELRDGNDVLQWLRDYRLSDKGLWLADPVRHI